MNVPSPSLKPSRSYLHIYKLSNVCSATVGKSVLKVASRKSPHSIFQRCDVGLTAFTHTICSIFAEAVFALTFSKTAPGSHDNNSYRAKLTCPSRVIPFSVSPLYTAFIRHVWLRQRPVASLSKVHPLRMGPHCTAVKSTVTLESATMSVRPCVCGGGWGLQCLVRLSFHSHRIHSAL